MRRLLGVVVVFAAVLALAPAALARLDVARSGEVTATLAADRGPSDYGWQNVRVRISRGEQILVDEPGPRLGRCREGPCDWWPANANAERTSIFFRELDGDAAPEILAEFFSGGASCCLGTRVYDLQPEGSYTGHFHNWGTGYGHPRQLDGRGPLEFLANDPRFRGRFGCTACTPQPVQVRVFRDGRHLDVTRRFPRHIGRDARFLLSDYRRYAGDREWALTRGFAAAYVADLYLLRQGRSARRFLGRELARGHFRSAASVKGSGRAFVRDLLQFLRRTGYRR